MEWVNVTVKKVIVWAMCLMLIVSAASAVSEAVQASEPELLHLNYADENNWFSFETESDKPADLFIIAPTVDMGRAGNLLGDIQSEKYLSSFGGALNMELGIYDEVCAVYAPYYQQVTFPVYGLNRDESQAYFDFAYEDICLAFDYYLEHCDPERPLVLAGFSQGSDHAIRLVKDYFADEKMASRLVAVYAIGWRVTDEELAMYPHLQMARGETDTGVVIAFNSEAEWIGDSLMVPEGTYTYGINPLNWHTDATPAEASLNLGACFTTYSGTITNEINAFCGAYLDPVRGTLKVTGVDAAEYPAQIFPEGIYHIYDYQFFFRNLQKNVKDRVSAFADGK